MIYILWWKYHDDSFCDIARAYTDKERAYSDFKLVVKSEDDKEWKLTELEETR